MAETIVPTFLHVYLLVQLCETRLWRWIGSIGMLNRSIGPSGKTIQCELVGIDSIGDGD